jgi:hypothetical protein
MKQSIHFLVHPLESTNQAEEFPSWTVLEHIVESALFLKSRIKFDYKRMLALGLT